MKTTQRLHEMGQSLWLDNITRGLLTSGVLRRYVEDLSITGLTSNPTIFDHAIRLRPPGAAGQGRGRRPSWRTFQPSRGNPGAGRSGAPSQPAAIIATAESSAPFAGR